MALCDVCARPSAGQIIGREDFGRAVRDGYNPFSMGLTGPTLEQIVSMAADLRRPTPIRSGAATVDHETDRHGRCATGAFRPSTPSWTAKPVSPPASTCRRTVRLLQVRRDATRQANGTAPTAATSNGG